MLISACQYSHPIHKPYPLWGESVFIDIKQPRHMQIRHATQPSEGCLLIVHGMGEHGSHYQPIVEHFQHRYTVAAIDLTAHGLSNPVFRRADDSIRHGAAMYHADRAFLEQKVLRDLTPMRQDLDAALRYLAPICGEQPVFLLAHSLGGLISASYLIRHEPPVKIAGVVFSAPAFTISKVPNWLGLLQNPLLDFNFYVHRHFARPSNAPWPLWLAEQGLAWLTVPLFDAWVEFLSLPGIRYLWAPTGPRWLGHYLTDSAAELKRLAEDSYRPRRGILRYVLGIQYEIIDLNAEAANFTTPYLLIYSEHDPITPAEGARLFHQAAGANHHHNQLYELTGERHHQQLFLPPERRQPLLAVIDAWLAERGRAP
ncbi:MAG: alpha/beta fold hydrolase [Methylococcales bacterium]|nr:alpha/beta fold hydrolase [Methylococcales bacterium]